MSFQEPEKKTICSAYKAYLDEGGKLGLGKATGHSIQELRENRGNEIATFLDQLRDQVTDKQGGRLALRRVQEFGNELNSKVQSRLSAGSIMPNREKIDDVIIAEAVVR